MNRPVPRSISNPMMLISLGHQEVVGEFSGGEVHPAALGQAT
jgi:hypothetical protein